MGTESKPFREQPRLVQVGIVIGFIVIISVLLFVILLGIGLGIRLVGWAWS